MIKKINKQKKMSKNQCILLYIIMLWLKTLPMLCVYCRIVQNLDVLSPPIALLIEWRPIQILKNIKYIFYKIFKKEIRVYRYVSVEYYGKLNNMQFTCETYLPASPCMRIEFFSWKSWRYYLFLLTYHLWNLGEVMMATLL